MTAKHLVLYDGVCGLCNGFNRFVLHRDGAAIFRFASLQSAYGRELLDRYGKSATALDTVYVVADYRTADAHLLERARAALFVLKTLGGVWKWCGALDIVPQSMLDWGYNVVARYRYRIFGRYDSCIVPTDEYASRFIDV
ncbi:MAG: thiol-disulfide oxidoreductase DCC family protein [Gemmatimonadales bacterium]